LPVAHHGPHHDPARVARAVALPTALSPLSASPPVGPATASAEGPRHRVDAATVVRISVDRRGTPYAVSATQALTVRRLGDYYFTVGAPLVAAAAAPGSAAAPGVRIDAVIWEGFCPGTRRLAATLRLRTSSAAAALPLRVERRGSQIVLADATTTSAGSFTAPALDRGLGAALRRALRAPITRTTPLTGSALVTGRVRSTSIAVTAPLHVTGTVGPRRVDVLLDGDRPAVALPAGAVRLTVRPAAPRDDGNGSLLARVLRASYELARARQFEQFLANPDPTGSSATTYRYETATPPPPVAAAPAPRRGGGWARTLAVALGLAAALVAAVVVWARS
jgi:hypothetical protein